MKKMLAKAVALSLVLGGVGFVANDALAAEIGPAVDVETIYGDWDKVLSHKDGQAINAEVATNKANIDTNKANIAKNAENISANQKAIDKEVQDRKDAITQERNARTVAELNLGEQITQEKNARIDADKALRADLNQETIDRVDADNRLQTAIDQKADKTTVAENTAAIESNKAAIAQEKKDRDHADQKLQDQITINKGQIENEATNRANEDKRIEAKFDGEVSRLDGRIDKLDANVEKVGAMAAAIANLHTMGYDPEAPTEIAVGVGQYRDKTGLALGAFHYPNRDFMLSFSVSTAGDEFMGGIGATWRFGRKSPEELRQAEAEKAAKAKLAKAEAAKKAAKDARIAAQQKRHAEMLAARTGK
ncbi:YadA-like family protein [Phascolarctobacterium succinatutens]|uniref:YadA-like family protein n=1 Tax=Phascolarctobacterium succinatutens TaxID=626940 RepID=UPI0026EDE04D|nr:YadA-like family protein [Phascolarctobacterium succinatutens]